MGQEWLGADWRLSDLSVSRRSPTPRTLHDGSDQSRAITTGFETSMLAPRQLRKSAERRPTRFVPRASLPSLRLFAQRRGDAVRHGFGKETSKRPEDAREDRETHASPNRRRPMPTRACASQSCSDGRVGARSNPRASGRSAVLLNCQRTTE